jgi:hypothetical protein
MAGKDQFCGRFSPDQLNRPLLASKRPTSNSFFSKIISGLFFISSSGTIASGQTAKKEPVVLEEIKKKDKKNIEEDIVSTEISANTDSLKNTIQGNIRDRNGVPATFATVTIKSTNLKTVTDSFGNFKFMLPDNVWMNDSLSFEIGGNTYGGVFIIEKQNYNLNQQHCVAYHAFAIGGAVISVKGVNITTGPDTYWTRARIAFSYLYFQ